MTKIHGSPIIGWDYFTRVLCKNKSRKSEILSKVIIVTGYGDYLIEANILVDYPNLKIIPKGISSYEHFNELFLNMY